MTDGHVDLPAAEAAQLEFGKAYGMMVPEFVASPERWALAGAR